jgi:hypothetical protein
LRVLAARIQAAAGGGITQQPKQRPSHVEKYLRGISMLPLGVTTSLKLWLTCKTRYWL